MDYHPIAQDRPIQDRAYRATMMDVLFESHGAKLNGVMYLAAGAEAHPLIILLHGFPGHERNFDLAQIFRRAGYNVVIFHYRGAWGSAGDFGFKHVLEDVECAIAYFKQAEVAQKYRIDSENIILIGHSMGGWATLCIAAKGLVKRAASIAGVNLGLWGELVRDSEESRQYSTQFFEDSLAPLKGTSADKLIQEIMNYCDDFDFMQKISPLSQLDLFLIAGEQDDGVPHSMHHTPLTILLENKNPDKFRHLILDADHVFSDKRVELAQNLVDWLGIR